MAMTRAQLNRDMRRNEIRAQLATGGHLQHVDDMSDEIRQLARAGLDEILEADETDNLEEKAKLLIIAEKKVDIASKRAGILAKAIAGKNAIISKYMGDIKQQDVILTDETDKKDKLAITSTNAIEAAREYTTIMSYDGDSSH